MDLVEGRFTDDKYEFATLFQDHVGGTMDQVVAEAVRDRRESAHAARRDHHSEGYERATGDRGALRADAVVLRGEALYVLE